jgi:hypothetical protein
MGFSPFSLCRNRRIIQYTHRFRTRASHIKGLTANILVRCIAFILFSPWTTISYQPNTDDDWLYCYPRTDLHRRTCRRVEACMDGIHPILVWTWRRRREAYQALARRRIEENESFSWTALELEGDGQVGLIGKADVHVRTGMNGSALAASTITPWKFHGVSLERASLVHSII